MAKKQWIKGELKYIFPQSPREQRLVFPKFGHPAISQEFTYTYNTEFVAATKKKKHYSIAETIK